MNHPDPGVHERRQHQEHERLTSATLADWRRMQPIYEEAARLSGDPEVVAEIAALANETDPVAMWHRLMLVVGGSSEFTRHYQWLCLERQPWRPTGHLVEAVA